MLGPGTRLGHYEILSMLGVGGMGEVYRARDTRLGRDVALKVLPDHFASDAERLARFQREAHVLASLNHPHIASIHGLEESDGLRALVLELVEGETLADWISRGAIPLDEALPVATQIAEALEAAHEQGIIHRDLKPANIKITPNAVVKVLDFGLAKLSEPPAAATGPSGMSLSPTITSPALMTHGGMILGTAAYMSPEQAKGRPADRRSDLWAFGCVLYEMLTGQRPFAGEDVSETLASVLKEEPDWSALPPDTPRSIRALVERCLRKDMRRRLPDIGAARIEIEEARTEPSLPPRTLTPDRRPYAWPAVAVLSLLTGAGVAAWVAWRTPEPPTVEFEIVGPQGGGVDVGQPMSPDGRRIAFVADSGGQQMLWVRSLGSSTAQPLDGTQGAARPAWSPDSQHLAFFAQGRLKRVAIAGGPPAVICNEPGRDVAWGAGNVILIGGNSMPLLRVPAGGGEPTRATELGPGERTHDYPDFLPDGRHFLFMARRGAERQDWDVYVGSLDSPERRLLPGIGNGARYSPTGHVLFNRDTTLMAQPFDLDRLELTGDAFPVAEGVAGGVRTPFSVSADGSLAYLNQGAPAQSQLAWFDGTGRQLGPVGPSGLHARVSVSRDGRYVAFDRVFTGSRDIFLFDIGPNITSRFTSTAGADFAPVFSPDGNTIAFASSREPAENAGRENVTAGNLYERAVGIVGDDKVLLKNDGGKTPTDWSRDGRYLAYTSRGDIWALPLSAAGAGTPVRVTDTPSFAESEAGFSRDGRWIAYQSTESANGQDVYVQSFPGRGARRQVSASGGFLPRWGPDGTQLYYLAPDFTLMSVAIRSSDNALTIGTPVALFRTPLLQDFRYSVTQDGRFLLEIPVAGRAATPLTVVVNWAAGLTR